ncbi:unnamed protein product [Ectocarpus sp. CCAP 1310/34]|nr:unnamed protein product [Ectocarpus sp. CCAP 1310/34]
MSVSSRGSLSKQGARGDDDASQGLRSRASSVISDVIEGGGLNDDSRQNKANSQPSLAIPALLPLEGKTDNEDGSYKTPSRVRLSCETSAGGTAADGADKENSQVGAGLVGGGKKREGDAALEAKKQISGQKRTGGDIEKQKSFTGSYFQVSPSSFLKSSKRQRNFA